MLGKHVFFVEHLCQLATGKAIEVRNLELAYKRDVSIFGQITLHLESPQGIGSVEHHKFDVVFGCGFHSQSHRTDVGERTATDILDIVDQHIYPLQHIGGSLAGLAIERTNGKTGGGIGRVVHMIACMHIAAHAVFRTEQRYQIYVGSFMQNIDGGFELVVHSGRIGDQAHSFPLQYLEITIFKNLYSCLDSYFLSKCRSRKKRDHSK